MKTCDAILMLMNKPGGGGAESVFEQQAEYIGRKGVKVFLGSVLDSHDNTSGTLTFGFRSLFDILAYIRLIAFIRRNRIGVVYATLDYAIFVSRIGALACPSVRVFVRESGMADRKSLTLKTSDIIFNARAEMIIAVSEEVAESIAAYQPFYRKKIRVIPNGVIPSITPDKFETVHSARLVEGSFSILNVGSMKSDNKGQKGLIDLVEYLKKTHPRTPWKLVLAGEGPQRKKLEEYAEKRNIQENIEFTGFIKGQELSDCYLRAHVFVLNSASEGCPNVVLEAMAHGLPVITTPVGGISSMVIPDVTGWVVQRDDIAAMVKQILFLVENKESLKAMGVAGFYHVTKQFDFSKQTEEVFSLFHSYV